MRPVRFTIIALAVTLSSCTAPRESTKPLVVGPGPCGDVIAFDPSGLIQGCVAVPLIEAVRTDGGTVVGRVLVAGSLEPWPNVNIAVIGRLHGVGTDEDGRFSLGGLAPEERIIVNAIGMWPDTLVVGLVPGPLVEQVP